jgi:DNA-3-methyladenine glycosylase II
MPDTLDAPRLEAARRRLLRRDPRLARVIRRVGPCGIEASGDPYRSLVRSVLHQQLAGAAARAIEGRLKARYRGRYPAPAVLARAGDAELREAGLSRQKSATLRAVASAFAEGRLDARRLRAMSDEEVTAAVTEIRGIGEWTAHMLLITCFASPDVLPVGDFGVRKGAQRLYGLPELPKRAELEALAEPWRPYRSVGAWYLWRVLEDD